MSIPWSPVEVALLREKFSSCKSIKEVTPFLPGRTYNAIRAYAQEIGVKMKKLPTYDKAAFSTPTEVNCSIAGFLAADGYVSEKGRLTVNLSSKDRSHLETIVRFMAYTGRIYDYSRAYNLTVKKYGKESLYSGTQKTSTIQIQCPEACADLFRHWNITTRKSKTLCPPHLTDLRLIAAFLSGFIDGDGWIVEDASDSRCSMPQYSIALIGTRAMLEWTKSIFDACVPNASNAQLQDTESEDIYDYKVTGTKAYWLAKIFLSLDIPRLDRKWDKLRRMISLIEGPTISKRLRTNLISCCPPDDTLNLFGLGETKRNLLLAKEKDPPIT